MLDRLVDLLLAFLHLFKCWFVIDQDEAGVLLRLGRYRRILGPGLHWILPLSIHQVRVTKVVQGTMRLYDQGLTTADDKDMTLSAVVTFHVEDPKRYLVDMDGGSAVDDVTYGAVAEWVAANTRDYIRDPGNWPKLESKIRHAAKEYGVRIVRVKFGDLIRAKALRLLGNQHG